MSINSPWNKTSSICKITEIEWLLIRRESMHNMKIAKSLANASEYPHHILQHHKEEASEFLKAESIRKISIKDVKEFLDNKLLDNPLSTTAVHYLMKKILGYSYKKANKIPHKMMSKDSIRDFIEAAYLQVYLEKEGYRLVYLDEFHLSMKSRAIYNWSLKGPLLDEQLILTHGQWALLSLFHQKELKESWLRIFPSNRFHTKFSCQLYGKGK